MYGLSGHPVYFEYTSTTLSTSTSTGSVQALVQAYATGSLKKGEAEYDLSFQSWSGLQEMILPGTNE
jgi:hypothetical protein